MSFVPSQTLTSPDAMSVSMILGTPNGSARMTMVAVFVPVAPAHETIPSQRPAARISRIFAAPADPTIPIAVARGAAKTSSARVPVAARTSRSGTSAHSASAPRLRSMTIGSPPASATASARCRISVPFVSSIPATTIFGFGKAASSVMPPTIPPGDPPLATGRPPVHTPPLGRRRVPPGGARSKGGHPMADPFAGADRPVWVELSTSDPAAARAFYGDVFGWEMYVSPDPQYGGYAMGRIDGKDVAGIGAVQPGAPTAWSLYIGTSDADAVSDRVQIG